MLMFIHITLRLYSLKLLQLLFNSLNCFAEENHIKESERVGGCKWIHVDIQNVWNQILWYKKTRYLLSLDTVLNIKDRLIYML